MGYSREISDSITSEMLAVAKEFSNEFANRLSENDYSLFSLYTLIMPAILAELTSFVLPQSGATGPAWNYLDAACSIMTGVNQLSDSETHRPIVTKVKGAVNIGSAAQLITLTVLNFAWLGSPAFAAAFGANFLLSLDETARAFRRKHDFEYWLKDSLAQLEKLASVKQALRDEIDALERAASLKAGRWVLNRKQERLKKFGEDQAELEMDILFRVAAKRFEKFEREALQLAAVPVPVPVLHVGDAVIETQLNACGATFQQTHFMQDLLSINNCANLETLDLRRQDLTPEFVTAREPITRATREQEVQKKCNKHVLSAVKDSFICGVAFAGVLLTCIPGCQLAGLIVVGIASAMYLAKNVDKFCSAVKKGFNYFFGSPKKKVANENNESENLLNAAPSVD